MKEVKTIQSASYHALEGGRGYASVQLSIDGEFLVLTTPISMLSAEEHKKQLEVKMNSLGDQTYNGATAECEVCGESFLTYNLDKKLCSVECWDKKYLGEVLG